MPPQWEPRFIHQEIWILNTEYRLFTSTGPQVSTEATHWSRLDEVAKCIAVAPANASLRIFWADAVISVEGDGLGKWMRFVRKKAPSEQQLSKFLYPNIAAAWRGERSTRTVNEAMASRESDGAASEEKPTPGIRVWRSEPDDGEAFCWSGAGWPRGPTSESLRYFLQPSQYAWFLDHKGPEAPQVVGVLLDVDGTPLRCLSASPLSPAVSPARSGQ
ncbi:unnamed protein product, partial [Polarella glacialis]